MNHQPYEDWLFADPIEEPLTPQQQVDLQAHLLECESCRSLAVAWQAVEADLNTGDMIWPRAGFTARWEERLEIEHARLHRRQSLAMLGFVIAGLTLLFTSLLLLAMPLLNAPDVWLWTGVYQGVQLIDDLRAIQETILKLLRGLTGVVPRVWWVLGLGVLSQLVVLWIVSLRVLTNPRRVTR